MNRRQLIERSTTLVAMATSALWAGASAAADKKAATQAVAPVAPAASMDPHHHHHLASEAASGAHEACMPGRFTGLVAPFQVCTAAVAVCIAHCQVMLADGDKTMGACLRTALDCDITCNAVLRAATLNSDFTRALAQTAILAMEACVKACQPHVDHHAECRDCHGACLAAIAAARKLPA